MLVLGLLLLLLAAGLLIGFLSSGTQEVEFKNAVLGITLDTLTIYLLGALTLLLVVAGLTLLRLGIRHAAQRRKEHKELNRLSAKLERHEAEQREDGSDPTVASTAGGGDATTTTTPTAPQATTPPGSTRPAGSTGPTASGSTADDTGTART